MEFISANYSFHIFDYLKVNFVVKLTYSREVWLFNVCDGCQQILLKQNIKINQISKIIITDLHSNTISGLLGLLCSLNLSNRCNPIYIYAPLGIREYINSCKKYSHTNFGYNIYIYVLTSGLIIDHNNYKVYTIVKYHYFELLILSHQISGKFAVNKAYDFNLISGPLYGHLKQNLNFILPDGCILSGRFFTHQYSPGIKAIILAHKYHDRWYCEHSFNSHIILYRL